MFFRDLCIRVAGIERSILFLGAGIIPRCCELFQARPSTAEHRHIRRRQSVQEISVDFGNLMEEWLMYPGYVKIVDVKNEW